ncbi:MAG: hypothetical protein R3E66_19670 [bacterium]
MYRIKTDIRQYKCDTKEKVEKLIRNWVIRPNDLIYQADQQRWSPIGEHPAFTELFAVLEAQERAEPDTVVTQNPLESEGVAAPAVSDEVTHIKARPQSAEPSESPASNEPADAIEEPEEDIRMTDVMDSPLAPPSAPEGVEPQLKPDEVTMMTERTLDLMKITDEVDSVEDDPNVEREPTVYVQDQSEPEDFASDTPDEPSIPAMEETEELGGTSSAVEEMAAASDAVNPLEHSRPKLGRHDLPEDFFATNELEAPVDREKLRDDLAALESAREEESVDDAWGTVEEVTSGTEETSAAEAAPSDSAFNDDDDDDDEWDDYDDLDPVEIAAQLIEKHSDRVADVYNIPLPFEIVPTPEDLAVGLKRSTRSAAAKAASFPTPVEKEYKKAHLRTFVLTKEPPQDRTPWLIAGIVAFLVLVVIVIVIV